MSFNHDHFSHTEARFIAAHGEPTLDSVEGHYAMLRFPCGGLRELTVHRLHLVVPATPTGAVRAEFGARALRAEYSHGAHLWWTVVADLPLGLLPCMRWGQSYLPLAPEAVAVIRAAIPSPETLAETLRAPLHTDHLVALGGILEMPPEEYEQRHAAAWSRLRERGAIGA
jgi:hypothetical protein